MGEGNTGPFRLRGDGLAKGVPAHPKAGGRREWLIDFGEQQETKEAILQISKTSEAHQVPPFDLFIGHLVMDQPDGHPARQFHMFPVVDHQSKAREIPETVYVYFTPRADSGGVKLCDRIFLQAAYGQPPPSYGRDVHIYVQGTQGTIVAPTQMLVTLTVAAPGQGVKVLRPGSPPLVFPIEFTSSPYFVAEARCAAGVQRIILHTSVTCWGRNNQGGGTVEHGGGPLVADPPVTAHGLPPKTRRLVTEQFRPRENWTMTSGFQLYRAEARFSASGYDSTGKMVDTSDVLLTWGRSGHPRQ